MPPKVGRKGKGKGKKAAPTVPPYYDYSTYKPPQWQPAFTELEELANAAQKVRSSLQRQTENNLVILRIRQVDWEYHDVFILAEKNWTVLRLMRDVIAEQIHGGAVGGDDVMILLGKEEQKVVSNAEEKGDTQAGTPAIADGNEDGTPDKEVDKSVQKSPKGTAEDSRNRGASSEQSENGNATLYADPFTRLKDCFPEVERFEESNIRPEIARRPPLATLPQDANSQVPGTGPGLASLKGADVHSGLLCAGLAMFTHELQARLTEKARQIQIAAAGAIPQSTTTFRRSTLFQLPGLPGVSRRSSFMLPAGAGSLTRDSSGLFDQGVLPPLPPIQLPQAVTIWYDIRSYTATRSLRPSSAAPMHVTLSPPASRKRSASATTTGTRPSSAKTREKELLSSLVLPDPGAPSSTTAYGKENGEENLREPVHRFDRADPVAMFEVYNIKPGSRFKTAEQVRPASATVPQAPNGGGMPLTKMAVVAKASSALMAGVVGRRRAMSKSSGNEGLKVTLPESQTDMSPATPTDVVHPRKRTKPPG